MTRLLRRCALLPALFALVALAACGGSDTASSTPETSTTSTTAAELPLGPAFGSMDGLPGVLKSPPPWPANAGRLQLRLREIGLPALSEEGQVIHTHQHLELVVEGKPVAVASDIGIAADRSFISPLHTHQPDPGDPPNGILHVESPTQSRYSLGQFFAVWGLRLNADCIGARCTGAGRQLRMWVNGKPVKGDPTRIVLEEHQQIVIAYGTAAQMPKRIASTYDWDAAGV